MKVTLEMIREAVATYTIDGEPIIINKSQAQALLEKWKEHLPVIFCDFIHGEVQRGKIINEN